MYTILMPLHPPEMHPGPPNSWDPKKPLLSEDLWGQASSVSISPDDFWVEPLTAASLNEGPSIFHSYTVLR
jgi:hypothetical protein